MHTVHMERAPYSRSLKEQKEKESCEDLQLKGHSKGIGLEGSEKGTDV